jgi:hypothetical protein
MQIATTAFSIVPVHLFNIFIALLCSNHVNRSFGKGLVPRQYRLRWAEWQSCGSQVELAE